MQPRKAPVIIAVMADPVRHLYFHIPFCHRICPYCAFVKHTPGRSDLAGFVAALLAELDFLKTCHEIRPETVYFGGGTPTLLSTTHLGRLLEGLAARLDLAGVNEWTVEANPRTFDLRKARLLVEAGVTRVSLGVQSWNERHLATLGRDHRPDEARAAYDLLRAAAVPSVNIDHMFALPGQSLAEWEDDLTKTIALAPEHVSTYNLTYEEDTAFMERFRSGQYRTDPEADADFFELAHRMLGEAGFEHYETSNHARPGQRSIHNQAYWRGHDYLGLGPGAVSTVGRRRWTNIEDTGRYTECARRFGTAAAGEDILTDRDWLTERIGLELRTSDGLSVELLDEDRRRRLEPILADGLAALEGGRVVLSERGRLLADAIAGELV